jgi:carbonic anhydrase
MLSNISALNTVLSLSLVPACPSQPNAVFLSPGFTVVVVGHTECGGAAACFNAANAPTYSPNKAIATDPSLPPNAPLNRWLSPLTHLAASLQLSSTPKAEALPILVEENVRMQVQNLCQTPIVANAWANKSAKGKDVWVHGWVYDLAEGKLRDLGITQGPS